MAIIRLMKDFTLNDVFMSDVLCGFDVYTLDFKSQEAETHWRVQVIRAKIETVDRRNCGR